MDLTNSALISAILVAAIALARLWSEKKPKAASAANHISSGYERIVDDWQELLAEAKQRNTLLREEIRTLQERMRQEKGKRLNAESQFLQLQEVNSILEGANEVLRNE